MKIVLYLIIVAIIFILPLTTLGSEGGSSDPFSQTKFVPAISFVMDVSYLRRNLELTGFEMPGFIHAGHSNGHAHSGSLLNGENGFNLNYAELNLFATVDPYFDLFTAFHLGEDHFEVEEAYVTTRKLPHGFGLKMGKFLSAFGRINAQHAHTWNFQELPLVYRVFFGEDGLNEKGFQLNWVAPTDFYLSLGFELFQGENSTSFGLEGTEIVNEDNGSEIEVEGARGPGLFTVYAKTSVDIGDLIILGGVSYAGGETRSIHETEDREHVLSGRSRISGLDITIKYLLDSYRYISLQTEYIDRQFEGEFYEAGSLEGSEFSRSQSGFYSELVYRFSKLWRTALRYDLLNRNNVLINGADSELPEDMKRYSFMIDYTPTEFSRIRLQYNNNRYLYLDGDLKTFSELNLQLNISIGAHGAHPF